MTPFDRSTRGVQMHAMPPPLRVWVHVLPVPPVRGMMSFLLGYSQ